MTESTIKVTREASIATLSFNRPQDQNTYNIAMSEDLPKAVAQIKNDPTIRVLCLKGEGDVFMAGGDIRFFAEHLNDALPDKILPLARALHTAILDLQTMPKPVIACVHGAVAGAGMSLMLAADLVLASEETVFTMAYSQLGLSADGGATYFLPRHLGHKKAMELLLFADRFSAAQALDWGLINWIAPSAQMHERAASLLKHLSLGPTQAYAEIKRLVLESSTESLATQLESEAHSMSRLVGTQDFANGVKAFIQKRTHKSN